MKRFAPIAGLALLVLLSTIGPALAQTETAPDKPSVAIGPFIAQNTALDYQAAARGLEDNLAYKLRYSRKCYTVELVTLKAEAADKGVVIDGPDGVRQAMVALRYQYGLTGVVTGQGGLLNADVSVLSLNGDQTSVLTTFQIPGSTSDLNGLYDAIAVKAATELMIPDVDGAHTRIKQAELTENQDAAMAYYMAQVLLQGDTLEQCEGASAKFQEALTHDPEFREARRGLGNVDTHKSQLLAAQGDMQGALEELGNASAQFVQAGESRAYSDTQVAAAKLYAQTSNTAGEIKCYHNAVRALIMNGSHEALEVGYRIIIDGIGAQRMDAESYMLLGMTQRKRVPRIKEGSSEADTDARDELHREAAVWFIKSYEENPANMALLIEMGNFYRNAATIENHLDLSVRYLNEATALDSKNWEAWMELGDTYTELRMHEQALNAYDRGAEFVPIDRAAIKSRMLEGAGRAHYAMTQFEQAIVILEQSIELEPMNVPAAVLLVLAYARAGDTETAKLRLEEIISQFPAPLVPWDLQKLREVLVKMEDKAVDPLDAPHAHASRDIYRFGGEYNKRIREDEEQRLERERQERNENGGGRPQ